MVKKKGQFVSSRAERSSNQSRLIVEKNVGITRNSKGYCENVMKLHAMKGESPHKLYSFAKFQSELKVLT